MCTIDSIIVYSEHDGNVYPTSKGFKMSALGAWK